MRSEEQIQRWINDCLARLKNPNTSPFLKQHDREQTIMLLWVQGKSFQEAFDIVDRAESGDAAELASAGIRPQG